MQLVKTAFSFKVPQAGGLQPCQELPSVSKSPEQKEASPKTTEDSFVSEQSGCGLLHGFVGFCRTGSAFLFVQIFVGFLHDKGTCLSTEAFERLQ